MCAADDVDLLAGMVIGPYDAAVVAARPQDPEPVGQRVDEVVVDGVDDVDALDADAGLPGVAQAAPGRCVGGGVEVGVLVDDQRVLAAALDEHGRQRLGARRHDRLAGPRTSR